MELWLILLITTLSIVAIHFLWPGSKKSPPELSPNDGPKRVSAVSDRKDGASTADGSEQAGLLKRFRECTRPVLTVAGCLPGSHWDWHNYENPVRIAALLIQTEPSVTGLRARCSDEELVEIIAFASHCGYFGYQGSQGIEFNRDAIRALGQIRTPMALGRLRNLVDQSNRPRSDRQPAIDALSGLVSETESMDGQSQGRQSVKGFADLMEEYKCNAAVHYRWESEQDAKTVFTALRTGKHWLPPEAVVVRMDGRQVAPYQPYWVSVCWPNEKLRDRPFKDWWQYMSAVGLPEQNGWKANWEQDSEERIEYESKTKLLEFFCNRPEN